MLSSIARRAWIAAAIVLTASSMLQAGENASSYENTPSDLQQRFDALEAEFRLLKQQQEAINARYPITPLPPVPAQQTAYRYGVNDHQVMAPCHACYDGCDPLAAKAAKYPTARITGFFQADAGWFGQDANSIATVGDIQDGADFRRARLAAAGDAYDNVSYMIEMDFAFPGRPSFMDVQMTASDINYLGNVRVGQWRQPFGMDAMTSVKELMFLERALPFAFVPLRQIGVGSFDTLTADERATYAISVFRFPTDVFGDTVSDEGGYGMSTRWTALPYFVDDGYELVHLGVNYAFIDPGNNAVQYRNQPEFFVGETGGGFVPPSGPTQVPFFVDTGAVPTQNVSLYGAELGAAYGSLYGYGEVMYASVNQIGGPRTTYTGAYAQAAYLLTGEVRPYNKQAGVFGRVKPLNNFHYCEGWGAWEVAARWSYLNLNDANVRGGILNDVTIGLNWYWNTNTKFQLNYIHAMLNNPTFGDSDTKILAVRCQVDF